MAFACKLCLHCALITNDISRLSYGYPVYTKQEAGGGVFIEKRYKPYNNTLTPLDRFRFSDEQKEKLPRFGDMALAIHNAQEFIHRVAKAAEGLGYELHDREAIYYDEKVEVTKEQMDLLTRGLYHFSFFKRQKYRYQQEYRLAIAMEKSCKNHIERDIKDISDISFKVCARQLLEEGIDIQN